MATSPSEFARTNRLTRDDILGVVGDVEDATITALLAIGASHLELEQAVMWANGDGDRLGRPLTGRTAQAYDILLSDPAFAPADEDR
jgi:hypothetical protein